MLLLVRYPAALMSKLSGSIYNKKIILQKHFCMQTNCTAWRNRK